MGQQQLLLLVLATVIVGLATVAGIQAFSENQAQASQDALVQRGTSIASDIQGLYGKPSQMGGLDNVDDVDGSGMVDRLGYESNGSGSGAYVDADGAGSGGECQLATSDDGSNGRATITCDADGAEQTVTVGFDPDKDPTVQTSFDGTDPFSSDDSSDEET